MKIILSLLLVINLYAQEIITVSKGSARWIYTPVTTTNLAGENSITFYGNVIPSRRDTGATYKNNYLVYNYTGGAKDSLRTLGWQVTDPVEDTTGVYYCSVLFKTQGNNWVWAKGIDSSFTTLLKAPSVIEAYTTEDYEVNLDWDKLTSKTVGYTQIWRKYNHEDSSYALIDSTLITEIAYSDSGLAFSASYQYKVRHRGNTYSTFSESNIVTISIPNYQFSYVPSSINIVCDSTGTDTSFTVLAVNNSGGSITLNDITGEVLPFTITADSSLPETVVNGDTLGITITFNRDTTGTFSQTATFDLLTFDNQTFPLYAQVTQPPPADTTAPDPIDAILATGYNVNAVPKTFIKVDLTLGTMSADADSIYWYRSNVNSLATFTEWQRTALNVLSSNDTIPEALQYRNYYVKIKDDNGNLSWVNPSDSGLVPDNPIPPPVIEGDYWYVDKNATGSNNGTSWVNAWESFSAISWASISAGDVVWVSGGTDSTIYYEQLNVGKDGTSGNPITIRNSYESGHNGRVIIDGGLSRTTGIYINGRDYIYVKGFEVRNHAFSSSPGAIYVYVVAVGNTIDSCIVTANLGRGITIRGNNSPAAGSSADNTTIKNCTIITPLDEPTQTDGIYAQDASNITIDNSFIWARNLSLVNNHSDGLQAYKTRGWRITNSVFICDSNAQGMAIILGAGSTTAASDSVIMYNNIIINRGIWWAGDPPDVASFNTRWYSGIAGATYMPVTVLIHNTIISYGPDAEGIRIYYPIALFGNNIVAQYGSGTNPGGDAYKYTLGSSYAQPVSAFSGENLYFREWSTTIGITGSGAWTPSTSSWASFVTNGAGGFIDNPEFEHTWYGNYSPLNYTGKLLGTSPAINAGDDLQSIVEGMGLEWVDMYDNPRDATPNIGCSEE